jgi:sigma-70-like protein
MNRQRPLRGPQESNPPALRRATPNWQRRRSGSLAAYEQLYATHGARMKSLARNLLGNAHDAENVVQEVFLKVHRSIANYRVEARTSFGHVTTDFPLTISGTTGGDSLRGTISSGACQLRLSNSSSSIEIRKSGK